MKKSREGLELAPRQLNARGTAGAHDFWTNVIHKGVGRKPGEEVRVARISAFVVGAAAMATAILLGPTANVAFLVALAFPLGFLGAFLGTLLSSEPSSQHKFIELLVRSNTGLGAEKAAAGH